MTPVTDSLTLDLATHTYTLNGRRVPGLTGLLKHFGFIDDGYYTPESCEVGSAVHLGTQALDEGRQDHLQFSDKRIVGRIRAYERFKEDKQFHPRLIEKSFAGPQGLYATTLDRLGVFGESPVEALVELKSGAAQAWHALQTGGQDVALPLGAPRRRFALYLRENESYSLVEHRDYTDGKMVMFLAAAYQWKANHGYQNERK